MRYIRKLRPNSPIHEWLYLTTGFAIIMITWRYVVVEARRTDWIPDADVWVMSTCGVLPFALLFWYSALWCQKVANKMLENQDGWD